MADLFDLAYAAGIIDGEGTIGISELRPTDRCRPDGRRQRVSPQHRIYVAVTMTDVRVVAWMHATFGGHLNHLRTRNPKHKPTTRWSMASTQAADFCRLIAPYLKVKREQAELAARFFEEHQGKMNRRALGLPTEELEARRAMWREMCGLNKRGVEIPQEIQ